MDNIIRRNKRIMWFDAGIECLAFGVGVGLLELSKISSVGVDRILHLDGIAAIGLGTIAALRALIIYKETIDKK